AFKDVQANLKVMNEITKAAVKGGAELTVFPELCTTGYSFMSEEEARPYAEPVLAEKGLSPSFEHMRGLSTLLDVAIVWGFVEDAGHCLYNSQALVFPDGQETTNRKRNRWGNDFLWATPGDVSPTILSWKGKTIGPLICRDV